MAEKGGGYWLAAALSALLPLCLADPAAARPACAEDAQGVVVAVDGEVSARTRDGVPFEILPGTELCAQDEITTGTLSRVEFRLAGRDTTTGTSSNAITVIPEPDSDCVTLLGGILSFISSVEGRHCVRTPFIDAGIEGTEAIVAVDPATGDSFVLVRAGVVLVADRRFPDERLALAAGVADARAAAFATVAQPLTAATPGNVPAKFRELLLDPEGATDWAVYYPPILLGTGVGSEPVERAAALLGGGEPDAAERLLLASRLDGRAAAAGLALRAVAAVQRNDAGAGAALADEAVALAPDLGAAHIARSYALQGLGRLEPAAEAAEAAVAAAPGDAYAWARLAELRLTLGESRAARAAVRRSLAIGETALGRTIEGFAALAAADVEAAEAAFARAIAIDSEAPLPRLGLGLAAIREGRVEEGRLEMEAAVALDPRRASLRTWLGRAYLEQDQPDEAAAQLALAKDRDPDDPNAYLFSALERFRANDPIGALRELEGAQARGEGRAVVRSEAGLGEDRAVRSAAIGRVYDLLGFERLFQITAAAAVDADPTNPEAHRLLADAARTDPDAEIVQVSEYWKSTLLAPPSKTPIQPQLGAIDLGLLETSGPARVTFAEYAPLFESEGLRADLSAFGGTQSTFGYEGSVTALVDNFSFGIGGFLYDTEGYFFNNDLRDEVYRVQAKFQPAPELTLTTEFGRQTTEGGDRRLSLPPFLPRLETLRISSKRDHARLGFHFRPNSSLSVLGFGEAASLDRRFDTREALMLPQDFDGEEDGARLELTALADLGGFDLQAGGEYARIEEDARFAAPPFVFLPLGGSAEIARAYGYLDVEFPERFFWTFGGAFEHYEEDAEFQPVSLTEWQPRAALRYRPVDEVELRVSYSEALTRRNIFPDTLDRTTLAGFGQYFDDAPAVEYRVLSGGIDTHPARWLDAGVEVRTSDVVFPDRDGPAERTVDMWRFGGYLSVTPFDTVALSFEPSYETLDAPTLVLEVEELDTLLLPATVSYFHASGAFASAKATYFDQEGFDAGNEFSDAGIVVDAVLGFRFPNGRGAATLQALNLFDADVRLIESTQSVEFGNFENTLLFTPLFAPDRTIFATVTLNFF